MSDFINLDYVAYAILAILYIFVGVPAIGNLFQGEFSNYNEDFKVGFCVHAFLAMFSGFIFALLWAINRVLL